MPDLISLILELLCGAFIGFAIGMTGIGGGVLVLPALTVILKMETTVAIGTASFYSTIAKSYAVYEHFRLKTIDFYTSILFLIGAIPGSVISATYINSYLISLGNVAAKNAFQEQLQNLVAFVIIISIVLVAYNLFNKNNWKAKAEKPTKPGLVKKIIGVVFGLIIGALIGATSVGGGIFVIPLLAVFFGLSSQRIVGSSIFIALVLTFVTALIFGKGGQLDYVTGIIMFLGSVGGIYYGSRVAVKLPARALQAVVLGVICLSGLLMLVKS